MAPRKKPLAKAAKSKASSVAIYQFKITLLDSRPAIWRRIQVADGTLDSLHEAIQTAMGWRNSHLHQFDIDDEIYGDPDLLQDGFDFEDIVDSTLARIVDIIPPTAKKFRFVYEYDFGDGWRHEVLLEKIVQAEAGKKYPLCLEGERACPPEDVGGVYGYGDFLDAIGDPKHPRHKELIEWRGPFDPETFDVKETTDAMREGVVDWREEMLP